MSVNHSLSMDMQPELIVKDLKAYAPIIKARWNSKMKLEGETLWLLWWNSRALLVKAYLHPVELQCPRISGYRQGDSLYSSHSICMSRNLWHISGSEPVVYTRPGVFWYTNAFARSHIWTTFFINIWFIIVLEDLVVDTHFDVFVCITDPLALL